MKEIVLATSSSKHLGLQTGDVEIGRFPDNEVSVILKEDVNDKHVFIVGSTETPAENLVEVIFLIHKVVSDGAGKVTLILPYLGNGRGDREAKKGEVASAQAVIKALESVSGGKLDIVGIDLHSSRIKDFFTVPVREISMVGELATRFKKMNDLCVVAPDEGARNRVQSFAKEAGVDSTVFIKKERISDSQVKVVKAVGEVRSSAVIVDDMVTTGSTVLETAATLSGLGATEIFVAVTHMVYSAGGWKKLADSKLISRIFTTDTIAQPEDLSDKFEIVGISKKVAELIES